MLEQCESKIGQTLAEFMRAMSTDQIALLSDQELSNASSFLRDMRQCITNEIDARNAQCLRLEDEMLRRLQNHEKVCVPNLAGDAC